MVVATIALAACSSPSTPSADPPPTPTASASSRTTPSPSPSHADRKAKPRLDHWRVGARLLPLRPDGFGQVLRTPAVLRDRRLPTRDLLPPPTDGRFHGVVRPVTPALVRRTGLAWAPACPVTLSELRYLEMTFQGFDGEPHTGAMVVNATVAPDVVSVFRTLYRARFPLEEMRLVTQADVDAAPTGDGNNTGAYACRPTVGTTTWSAHAYGLAVDVNPFLNPYVKGDLVLPELASAYLDRGWRRPGMILRGGVVVRAFHRVGWTWGGDFHTVLDLQHFSTTGH